MPKRPSMQTADQKNAVKAIYDRLIRPFVHQRW
jgi:hypothetical protein